MRPCYYPLPSMTMQSHLPLLESCRNVQKSVRSLPRDQLLQVNLHRCKRVVSAIEILRCCRSLIDCKITIMGESNSTPAEEVESYVQHLFIKGEGALQVAWRINAPKLESLNVCLFDTANVLGRQSQDRLRCLISNA
jgi:hypothetical protein